MSALRPILCASLALVSPAFADGAAAAPVAAKSNASGQVTVVHPLTLLKQDDLDFGGLVVTGAGTAVMNPITAVTTTTGPVTPVGAAGHPATFTATGSRNSVVLIQIPNSAATLTRIGGGGTMTVSNWTLDGSTNRRIPPTMAFNFSVGGTLNIVAGQLDGTYTGSFNVTVQYP